jgi:hypothetical protein
MSQIVPVGEDIGAVVVQLGSWYFRVGFAGDDSPRLFIRNLYGVSNSNSKGSNGLEEYLSKKSCTEKTVTKEESKVSPDTFSQELDVTPNMDSSGVRETVGQKESVKEVDSKERSYFTPSVDNPFLFFCDQCSFNVEAYAEEWNLSELLREDGVMNDWKAFHCLLKEVFAFLGVEPEVVACMFVEGERGLHRESYLQLARTIFEG